MTEAVALWRHAPQLKRLTSPPPVAEWTGNDLVEVITRMRGSSCLEGSGTWRPLRDGLLGFLENGIESRWDKPISDTIITLRFTVSHILIVWIRSCQPLVGYPLRRYEARDPCIPFKSYITKEGVVEGIVMYCGVVMAWGCTSPVRD